MRSKTRQAIIKEDYEYYEALHANYDNIIDDMERRENEVKYEYEMNDEELRDFTDNNYFELKDNYDR